MPFAIHVFVAQCVQMVLVVKNHLGGAVAFVSFVIAPFENLRDYMKRNDTYKTTRQIVYGAIMLSIFVVLYLIIPVGNGLIQSLLLIITPLPIMAYKIRFKGNPSVIILLSGIIICSLFIETYILIAYAIPSLIIGFIIGCTIEKLNKCKEIVIISVLHLTQNIFEVSIFYYIMNLNVFEAYSQSISESVSLISSILKTDQYDIYIYYMLIISIPVILIGTAFIKAKITYNLSLIINQKIHKFIDKIN